VHRKRLGIPAVRSINGARDEKNSEENMSCILSFQKNINRNVRRLKK
jgi:hypothetical protein